MRKYFKHAMALLAITLLGVSGVFQAELNRQRANPELGLDRMPLLENAPPLLAFTTVALGSFRGLIANALWMRSNQMQDEGRFFEMVQLSDWITKLEPHFAQVWTHQAWNMAYNISVRFSAPADRWRWVESGIKLLRDQGLTYNPTEAQIYQQLGWLFQHKIGYYLDDAHLYYKAVWFYEMNLVLGSASTNISLLVTPTTDDARKRAEVLRTRYKMDPQVMQDIEKKYGHLEWRLPEPHAIYWGFLGLRNCKDNPANKETLVTLRRLIYQSLHALVLRGRIISFTKDGEPQAVPDLDLIQVTNDGYVEILKEEETWRKAGIESAYRNFLRESTYELYVSNRKQEAEKWFGVLKQRFPEAADGYATMEAFAMSRLRQVISDGNGERVRLIVMGLMTSALTSESLDRDEEAQNYEGLARSLHTEYQQKYGMQVRVRLPEWDALVNDAICQLLDPEHGLYPQFAQRLMKKRNVVSLAEVCPNLKIPTGDIPAGTNQLNRFDISPPPKFPGQK